MWTRRALWTALLVAGCSDEPEVSQSNPRISVCPAGEDVVLAEACDRPFELGELPITLEHRLSLQVRSIGVVSLQVRGFEGTDQLKVEAELPFRLAPGQDRELSVTFVPSTLGQASARLEIDSDDETQVPYVLELRYLGVPAPAPRIELCLEDETCGPEVSLDLGMVRRTQRKSHTVTVRNRGTAALSLSQVSRAGDTSQDGELVTLSSTRAGVLEPGASAPLVLLYEPMDGGVDRLSLLLHSNDPENPRAAIAITAGSPDNFPPIAQASIVGTSSASLQVFVGDVVSIDGSISRDPEGDPIAYLWTLSGPPRSRVAFPDPTVGAVSFSPDVAGTFTVTLQVEDALEQRSPPLVLTVEALPRFALKAILEWSTGGDLDLHLLQEGGQLFGAGACYFEAPYPDWGDSARRDDDPELTEDAETSPGYEEIRLAVPTAGTYQVYVHYYDEVGAGDASATLSIVFDDASMAAAEQSVTLPETCGLWHVGEVRFPERVFTASSAPLDLLCP